MKKILFIVTVISLLFASIGCGDSYDEAMCLYKAREKYPNATIIPKNKFKYIAHDINGDVHYIEVGRDISEGITKDIVIIKSTQTK